jgi:hypothetical protein
MKHLAFLLMAGAVLAGCSSEQAPGWDGENRKALDALEKANGDLTKLSEAERKALEKFAPPNQPGRGISSRPTGNSDVAKGVGAGG